ncbi:MAG: efflux RND transporter periplasmic adaptor subunit, partial [Alphaproteobacteria bacterium]|nr:efflux RND transporter periplasmic adaptor subunit [Alphaproteobacteria bacterium]
GKSAPQYVAQTIARGPLSIIVSATGTLAPSDQVDVGAEVSGRLDAVNVDYNDKVKKGEVLAQINTDQITAQLDQAKATLAQAEATVVQNALTLKRYRALVKVNGISPQALDGAIADLARAKANVALGKAQVDQYQTQLSKTTIRSPIDGVVLDRKVSAGQTVIAALQTPVLFTLASDLARMELDVDIDEADVGQVHAGQRATFTVDAYPSRIFNADLTAVRSSPKTVNGVVTYQGVLMVDNTDGVLKPGMTATADILVGSYKNVLLVPNGALRFTPDKTISDKAPTPPAPVNGVSWGRVWMLKAGKLAPHDLKLGASDGHQTRVLSGDIAPGDLVVTDLKKPDTQGE